MVQSYRTTWGPNPAVQAKPRDQNHHCFRHLAHLPKLPIQSTLHCASRLQRQRSRCYKALTRGKRNFKLKTPTGKKRRNFRNFETHPRVRARSVLHFGLRQLGRTLLKVSHVVSDSSVNEKSYMYAF